MNTRLREVKTQYKEEKDGCLGGPALKTVGDMAYRESDLMILRKSEPGAQNLLQSQKRIVRTPFQTDPERELSIEG